MFATRTSFLRMAVASVTCAGTGYWSIRKPAKCLTPSNMDNKIKKGNKKGYKGFGFVQRQDRRGDMVYGNPAGDKEGANISSREGHRERLSNSDGYRTISLEEFDKDRPEIWVSWRGGVYDITPFVNAHPGGSDRLLMAKGCDLDKFWDVYKLHYRPHIQALIEDWRIGNLSEKDAETIEAREVFSNTYENEPPRPRNVISIRSERPWNGEARLHEITKQFYTDNEIHYTRNHNPVPLVDPDEFEFTIDGNEELGIRETVLSLHDLKTKFKPHHVTCTLQCAGNRQEEMVTPDRPLFVEAKWRDGAFGNAMWTGAKVRDVLRYCGLDIDKMATGEMDDAAAKWLNAIALDSHETGHEYASFIPFMKVIDPFGDTILAYEMNGRELPRDHGYPIRLLAPGIAGFRNVKWCQNIGVSGADPYPECDQKNQLFGPEISFRGHYIPGRRKEVTAPDLLDISAPRLLTYPVTSIIGYPGAYQTFPKDIREIHVNGIAWCGGGRGINRVEVSIDGGLNFMPAKLKQRPYSKDYPKPRWGYDWAWRLWEIDFPVTDEMKQQLKKGEEVVVEICARAVDGDFNRQPEHIEDVQNVLGKGINHWPRRTVVIDPKYSTGDDIPQHYPTPPPGQWEWKRTYSRVDLDNNEEWCEAYNKDFVNYNLKTPLRSEWSKLSPYKKAQTEEGELYYTSEKGRGSVRRDEPYMSPRYEAVRPAFDKPETFKKAYQQFDPMSK